MKWAYLFLAAAACAVARADEVNVPMEKLQSAIKAELDAGRNKPDASSYADWVALQDLLVKLIQLPETESRSLTQKQIIAEIAAKAHSEKLQTLSRAVLKQLQADVEKQENAKLEEMKKTYLDSLRTALNAKTATDVDAPLQTVSRLSAKRMTEATSNEKIRNLAVQGTELAEFLRQWQDGLTGDGIGHSRFSALQFLRNNSDRMVDWLPRSEVVTLLAKAEHEEFQGKEKPVTPSPAPAPEVEQESRVKQIMATVHQPADMAAALQKLEELNRATDHHCNLLIHALGILDNFQGIYLSLERGIQERSVLLRIESMGQAMHEEALANLRPEMLSYALPRVIGAGGADAPKPGESPRDYLDRMAVSARDKSDWALLDRVLETRQLSLWGTPPLGDRSALTSFLAGTNFVRARQYSLAVVSFVSALRSGSQIISPEFIGDRLDTIKKEHPQEYEKGMQLVERPATAPATSKATGNPFPQAFTPSTPSPK